LLITPLATGFRYASYASWLSFRGRFDTPRQLATPITDSRQPLIAQYAIVAAIAIAATTPLDEFRRRAADY
jgi:hypothetical protein